MTRERPVDPEEARLAALLRSVEAGAARWTARAWRTSNKLPLRPLPIPARRAATHSANLQTLYEYFHASRNRRGVGRGGRGDRMAAALVGRHGHARRAILASAGKPSCGANAAFASRQGWPHCRRMDSPAGTGALGGSPQRYQIAAGSRLWKIDEANNTVAASDSPLVPHRRATSGLVEAARLDVQDAGALLDAQPLERTNYEGRECLVYRVLLPAQRGDVNLEAFVDAQTKELAALVAWPADGARETASRLWRS